MNIHQQKYGITSFDKCIICQREKNQKKGTKRYEPLSNCETYQASWTLLNAAKVRQDERIIVAIEREDVVAIEVKYHRSCYKDYTSKNDSWSDRKKDKGKKLQYIRCSF